MSAQKELQKCFSTLRKKELIVSKIAADQVLWEACLVAAGKTSQPLGWRCAWVVYHLRKAKAAEIKPYLDVYLETLIHLHSGHQRELLKVFQAFELSEKQEVQLFDLCLGIWQKVDQIASVRIQAFKMLIRIAQKYPELKEELVFLNEPHLVAPLSPGIQAQFKKLYHQFLR